MAGLVPFGKNQHFLSMLIRDQNGSLTNPDELPTIVSVQKNGVDADEATVAVVQKQDGTPGPIAGAYNLVVDLTTATGLAVIPNDTISIVTAVDINGLTINNVADFTMGEFATEKPTVQIA